MTQDSTGKNACDISETRARAVDTACPWKTRVLERSLLSQVRVRKHLQNTAGQEKENHFLKAKHLRSQENF